MTDDGAAGGAGVPREVDALVVGAGPAGLAVAASLAERGLATAVVDPQPTRPWAQTFGAWADELPQLDDRCLARRWDDVRVVVGGDVRRLDRAYALLNNAAVQRVLGERLAAAGATVGRGRAVEVTTDGQTREVTLTDGPRRRRVRARVVVDASGHRPALLRLPADPPPPLQTAVGWIGTYPTPPATPGAMTFMDWTPPPNRPASPATFLYAMDFGGGRWLAEETSLAAAPPVADAVLADRLGARLEARAARPLVCERVERVRFPMGAPLPDRGQPVVGYGAAAGYVHPATGFSVARSLRRADALAAALADAVAAGHRPDAVARAGWAAVWTPDDLRQRRLFELGLASLLRLDAPRLDAFFGAFFDLPTDRWARYVSADGRAADVRGVMLRLLVTVPWPVRDRLLRAAVGHAASALRRR